MDLIRRIELEHMKTKLPAFAIGDTVRVSYKIREGKKERIQVFQGTVIAIKGGGTGQTMKVRRIVAGEGVERTFPLHSPKLSDVEVVQRGRVRRAKLYYLRDRIGKATRVRQEFTKVRVDPKLRGSLDIDPSFSVDDKNSESSDSKE
jgi:large subunit ribosomal protein L19